MVVANIGVKCKGTARYLWGTLYTVKSFILLTKQGYFAINKSLKVTKLSASRFLNAFLHDSVRQINVLPNLKFLSILVHPTTLDRKLLCAHHLYA